MTDKIYIIVAEKPYPYDEWNVVAFCRDKETAKKELEKRNLYKQHCKTLFYLEHNLDFNKAEEVYKDTENFSDEYEEICTNYILFTAKYPEVDYEYRIEEKELI